MSNVVEFKGITRLDLPVERIIDRARDAGLTEVIVIGYDADGDFYFAGSKADGPNNLWLLEVAKKRLLAIGDPDNA